MSRPRKLKLVKLADHDHQPHICVIGHGPSTYLWIGDKHCYSFTQCSPRELHDFAQAIIKRVMAPYRNNRKSPIVNRK